MLPLEKWPKRRFSNLKCTPDRVSAAPFLSLVFSDPRKTETTGWWWEKGTTVTRWVAIYKKENALLCYRQSRKFDKIFQMPPTVGLNTWQESFKQLSLSFPRSFLGFVRSAFQNLKLVQERFALRGIQSCWSCRLIIEFKWNVMFLWA